MGRWTGSPGRCVSDADREVVFTVPALFAGGWALEQLWLFWLAPIVGAAIAGIVYPLIAGETKEA